MIDFTRYLAAKKTVDDRALNRFVWERLRAVLADPGFKRPVRILEVGCGIGTIFETVLAQGLETQIERRDFIYIAYPLDFLGQLPIELE